MADGFLEKRYDAYEKGKGAVRRIGHTLNELLVKNRSCRGYDKSFVVTRDMLERIVSVNDKVPSARNQQVLRFRLVNVGEEADAVLKNIKLGGALPELHLPFPGTEPEAFIIVCSTIAPDYYVYTDLGISLQSMLLKAVEMGLNGICIGAFNKSAIIEDLNLPYEPLMLVAIGKGIEKYSLVPIHEADSHKYYRQDGIHCVPKIPARELIL